MLINPSLEGMSAADLNQRYAAGYIRYKGQIVYCHEFIQDDKLYVMLSRNAISSASTQVFEWDALDITRPPAGWYEVLVNRKGKAVPYPFYFQYLPHRQWRRSFSIGHTCTVFRPRGEGSDHLVEELTRMFDKPADNARNIVDFHELNEIIAKYNYAVLSKSMAVVLGTSCDVAEVFHRGSSIATIGPKGMELSNEHFLQELKEHITNIVISKERSNFYTIPPKKLKSARAPMANVRNQEAEILMQELRANRTATTNTGTINWQNIFANANQEVMRQEPVPPEDWEIGSAFPDEPPDQER